MMSSLRAQSRNNSTPFFVICRREYQVYISSSIIRNVGPLGRRRKQSGTMMNILDCEYSAKARAEYIHYRSAERKPQVREL